MAGHNQFALLGQRRFLPFPGSALAKKPPPWALVATLLDTQKVWGLTAAAIEPDWAIDELPHLLARKHFDPHWARSRGQVVASEQISLFGLVLAPKKPVNYGPIDPVGAHDIFVRQALVTGEITTRAGFVADNLKTLERAQEELLAWVGQLDPKGLEVLAASLGDLLTYVTTSLQLAWAFPDPVSG